ncbi:MAG: hypothetical protein L6R41_002228 [Letrouitia leprolyta]|nr:MAG: hypothetical protein L6R41_002228 [Letrouitia leprolyta]
MDALEDALVKLVRRETTSELELSSMARTSATSIIALQASSNSKRQIMTTNWILGEETPDVRRGIELPPAIIFGTLREKYLGQSIIAPHGAPDSFGKTHGYPTRRADEVSGDARCITSVYVDEARSEYDSLNDELRANDYMSGKGTSINNQLAGEFSDQAAENGDLLLQQLGRERGPGSRTFTATGQQCLTHGPTRATEVHQCRYYQSIWLHAAERSHKAIKTLCASPYDGQPSESNNEFTCEALLRSDSDPAYHFPDRRDSMALGTPLAVSRSKRLRRDLPYYDGNA